MIGDDVSSLPPVEKAPEVFDKMRRDIGRRDMQFAVALGTAGGLGVGAIIVNALVEGAKTEEEKEMARKLPLYVGAVGVTFAVFHLLDLDRRWLSPEGIEEIIEDKWGG